MYNLKKMYNLVIKTNEPMRTLQLNRELENINHMPLEGIIITKTDINSKYYI